MPTVAVIPVKSFRSGNRRLAGVLDDSRRAILGKALAGHVAGTVAEAGLIPVLVTGDDEVAAWAMASSFPIVPEEAGGLDNAAGAGVEWAMASGSRWMVIHSDLPLLSPTDLALLTGPGDVIAPSADGGTSAIAATGPLTFSYGPGSFHRHLARLEDPAVVTATGLLLDIDSPNDLTTAMSHPRGRWLREVMG